VHKTVELKIDSSNGIIKSIVLEPFGQVFKVDLDKEITINIPLENFNEIHLSMGDNGELYVFNEEHEIEIFKEKKKIF